MSWTVLLDNEAVQALADPSHREHHRVVGYAQIAVSRKARAIQASVAVPAAVRVETGWDRTASAWAFVNRRAAGNRGRRFDPSSGRGTCGLSWPDRADVTGTGDGRHGREPWFAAMLDL